MVFSDESQEKITSWVEINWNATQINPVLDPVQQDLTSDF